MEANLDDKRLKALAERVRSIIDEQGISARELARRAGMKSESHVGHLLGAKIASPSARLIEDIAAAGDVEVLWLWSGEGPRRRPRVVRDLPQVVADAIEWAVANQPENKVTDGDIAAFAEQHRSGAAGLTREELYEDLKSFSRRRRLPSPDLNEELQLRRALAAGGASKAEIEREVLEWRERPR